MVNLELFRHVFSIKDHKDETVQFSTVHLKIISLENKVRNWCSKLLFIKILIG